MIFMCLLLTAPNKGKIIGVSHVTDGVFWVHVYHDIVTCSQQKLKNFFFFFSLSIYLVDNHISPYFNACLMTYMRVDNEINYSHFFRGGWRGVLKWCNVRAHKRIISASTIDFRPTLTYESTSADLWQQRLTSFCAVCGVLFYCKRESTVVCSGQ